MKKLIHSIFCYKRRIVVDIDTKRQEVATYVQVFGLVVKTIYEPLPEDEQSKYLGII